MVSLITYKILAAVALFIIAIVAVAYPLKARTKPAHQRYMDWGDAFASGIFLGAALFHMLPEASEVFQEVLPNVHYPLAELFCAAGFILLLLLERLTVRSEAFHHHVTIPYLVAITLSVHSLIEGAALGVNTEFATAFVIFLAIAVHKSSESFALSITLCRGNHLSSSQLFWLIGIFALMTPLGILIGMSVASSMQFKMGQELAASFNAFAAGTFLYMSTLHHIHHHQRVHEAEGMWEFVYLVMGLSMMGLLVIWV